MPGMTGLELVTCMKEDYPLVPVVMMTSRGSDELAVKALEIGAASYVPKSQAVHELQRTIAKVLTAAGEERGISRLMHRLEKMEASFALETDLTLIPSIISYLQQVLTSMRFCGERNRLRIGIALEEALLNSYYHGNLEVSSTLREQDHAAYYELAKKRSLEHPYRERRIYVDVKLGSHEAVYVIRDEGPGFDPGELPDATDPANVERPCGRGLLLMRTFMDDVYYNPVGNEVTMIKRRDPADVEAADSPGRQRGKSGGRESKAS
jgi:anti-sigma regulatory factor (Ser/Thr protein kinase)